MAEISGFMTSRDPRPQNLMAKALYDNKAETPDELAFRKGEILTVIEQNIKGDEGWWRCSLHGRQGIVPGNRLQLLTGPQYDIQSPYSPNCSALRRPSQQNIYQIPMMQHQSSPLPSLSGLGDSDYQVPSRPQSYGQHYQTPVSSGEYRWDRGPAPPQQAFTLPRMGHGFSLNSMSASFADVYDIPTSHASRMQGSQVADGAVVGRKYSMFQTEGERRLIQQLYDTPLSFENPRAAKDGQVYDVPPRVYPDGAPGPYPGLGSVGREMPGFSRLQWDGKQEWRGQKQVVYDVPVCREDGPGLQPPSRPQTLPSRQALYDIPNSVGARLYDTPPAWDGPGLYDVPTALPNLASTPPRTQAIYDLPRGIPPDKRDPAAGPVYDIPPPVGRSVPDGQGSERWPSTLAASLDLSAASATPGHAATFPAMSQSLAASPTMPQYPAAALTVSQRPGQSPARALATPQLSAPSSAVPQRQSAALTMPHRPASFPAATQRRTTVPSESQSPSPTTHSPPAEEIRLGAEEAASTLSRLQQQVSESVAAIMVFVSRQWRQREHLQEHLAQVEVAADGVLSSLAAFLDFARGVRVNASRLTDANLHGRLRRQLEEVEESHRVLLDAGRQLTACGWALDALVVSTPLAAPDHLDSFVTVARTVPDDVKRLVSIVIANGKLLFPPCRRGNTEDLPRPQRKANLGFIRHKAPVPTPRCREQKAKDSPQSQAEDSDYVLLQKKEEFERQEKEKESIRQREKESFKQKKLLLERQMSEGKIRRPGDVSVKPSPEVAQSPSPSFELCRTYFSALQKAIVSFTDTINGKQPAEILIKHSKVVIKIGQKLVDTLCQETGQKSIHKEVLSRSNQFCGCMKKFAVATKNAVMQPNPTAVQEMKEQVAELRQQVDQLRLFLERNAAS
ncbi:cas scaffolding protein family member 4-like isoform X2 [Mobula birostris]|uniref:cas scaffolding protein family member 4-like isoform X2 n=1 Tax=Mobula birostris TaxID=1983395 RepID=UPI003B2844BE